jgi:hypothetical protein
LVDGEASGLVSLVAWPAYPTLDLDDYGRAASPQDAKAGLPGDRPGEPMGGEKNRGAAPSVPEFAAMREAHRPGTQLEVEASALAISILSPSAGRCRIAPARNPLACCGGGAVAAEAGRATSPGTRDTAGSPSHAIMRATAAAPYRVLALVVGRSPYAATPASRRRSSPRRASRAR